MRRTEINDAGQIDGQIDGQMDGQIARKADRRIGRLIDRATTSLTPYGLTPYGTSFWALILAACGGGGGGGGGGAAAGPETAGPPAPAGLSVSRSGHVYDGPIMGAKVYVDDGDGELTGRDHFVGTTDGRGWFNGSVPANLAGRRYIVDLSSATDLGDDGREGGTGVNADQTLSGTWLAPEGASVVSALTHLIATGVMTKAQIQSAYPDFDPLVDNPYTQAVAALPLAKQQAFEKIRKALPAITRLVEENRDLINQNSDSIKGLKTTIQSLEQKVAALQTRLTQTLETPPTAPPPPAPVNARPDVVELSREAHQIDEGVNPATVGVLARITIRDDGLGTVGLATLPQNSLFEYREISRTVYELRLKDDIMLDQSKVGPQTVTIRATGDGTGDNPAPVTFTLTVRNAVDDPTTGGVSVAGLAPDRTVQTGSSVTAVVDLVDPDDSRLDFTRIWEKKQGDGGWTAVDTDTDQSFTPDSAGTYRLKVTASDSIHNSTSPFFSREFTVTAPPAPSTLPPTTVEFSVDEDAKTSFDYYNLTRAAPADFLTLATHVVITRLPTKGMLMFDGSQVKADADFLISQSDLLTYQSAANGHGDNYDNFGFKLRDSQGRFSGDFTMRINVVDQPDQPTGMSFKDNVNSFTIDEGVVAEAKHLATINFNDPDTADAFLNNGVRIKSIDGVDLLPRQINSRFEIRNGSELWLKSNALLDYEHLPLYSTRHTGSHTIVVEYVTGDGERQINELTFTLNVGDVNEKPVVRVNDYSKLEIPGQTTQKFDTGVQITIYDPDSIWGGRIQEVAYELTDRRFDLEEYTPVGRNNKRVRTEEPGVKYYKLMAKAGQNFTPGQEVPLQISASDSSGNSDLDTVETITLAVASTVNTPPIFASSTTSTVQEGTTDTGYIARATATSGTVTYAITGGADRNKFEIDARTGVVTFEANSDYDDSGDADGNNIYDIIVTATATSQDHQRTETANQRVAIRLTNNPADDVVAPIFASSTTSTVQEGTTDSGYIARATATSGTVTYAITGGADRNKFEIDARTGVVTFEANSDYDDPGDADGNNIYDIIVTATATSQDHQRTETTDQRVAIRLTNNPADDVVAQPSTGQTILSVYGVEDGTAQTGETLTAPLNFAGSAGGTTQPAYEWQRKVNNAWQGVSGEASWRFTPDAAGTYRLKVTEGASGSQTQFFSAEFTVTASQGPLTLGFRNPAAAQSEIRETHGNDSGTGTGFYLTSSVSDLFTAARGTEFVRPVVKIESRQADGTFALDERFAVKADGRLSIKAGQSLDFESEHNPKGLIELRITVRDTAGNMTKLHVPIQLTDVANELPVGNLALRTEYGGSEEAFDPDSRLPVGTTFLVDENAFHDPEGVALTFTYKWMTWSRAPSGTVTTKLVGTGTSFTPQERHNQYKLELNVSDGSNAITAEQAFYVYALMPIHSTTFTYVENDPPYNGYLTTISPEFAQAYLESRELFIYKVNGVPVNDQNWNDLQFEIRNTYQLWMKTGATFDFEKYATYEQGSPRPASVSIEVVLRHSAGGGDALADEIFHFHVADVPENPIVTLNPIAALRGNDPAVFDFTLGSGEVLKRLAIYDPDDLAGEGKPGDLRYELSDERFELAAHDPDVHNKIVPRHLAGLHYSLKIKDGAQFDANETVPLTITAYEGAGTDVNGALTLTITIRPPTSGQSSGQGGGRANTEVVSYDDFSPDAGVEELGMVQNDFL